MVRLRIPCPLSTNLTSYGSLTPFSVQQNPWHRTAADMRRSRELCADWIACTLLKIALRKERHTWLLLRARIVTVLQHTGNGDGD